LRTDGWANSANPGDPNRWTYVAVVKASAVRDRVIPHGRLSPVRSCALRIDQTGRRADGSAHRTFEEFPGRARGAVRRQGDVRSATAQIAGSERIGRLWPAVVMCAVPSSGSNSKSAGQQPTRQRVQRSDGSAG
jgi:hypothetical protein